MSLLDIAIKVINVIPGMPGLVNRIASNKLSFSAMPRPHPYSLWSAQKQHPYVPPCDYLTWHTVTDKRYFDLHLKPADDTYINKLPSNERSESQPFGEVTALFKRRGAMNPGRSSVFFMFFAQWFTDGFFRSAPHDSRKTTTNHNIDLAQIYGADEEVAYMLRSLEGGKLNSQVISGEEYPDYLGQLNSEGKWEVKEKYQSLPYIKDKAVMEAVFGDVPEDQRQFLYATGLERGNAVVGHICFSTLFLREHNNICDELAKEYPEWDDERLFHTARIINTVILMKLVIEDYVNHIAGLNVLRMDSSFAEKQNWYRTPWIAGEFNLLYRWHSLIPDALKINDKDESFVQNYNLLLDEGLANIFTAASRQQAGKIGLHNTPDFMLEFERIMVEKGRDWRLRSYNDYRQEFSMSRVSSFKDFTEDEALQKELEHLYGHPDNVELTVGLFAESSTGRTLTGELQTAMVAYDALTQIYTNPLLAKCIFTEENFTKAGMKRINNTTNFQELVDRNLSQKPKVSLKYKS